MGERHIPAARFVLLLLLLVALAAAFLPAVAGDGCGGVDVLSAGCGAVGTIAAACVVVGIVAISLLRKGGSPASPPPFATTPCEQRAHGPPASDRPATSFLPLRL